MNNTTTLTSPEEANQPVRLDLGTKDGVKSMRISFTDQRLTAHGGLAVRTLFGPAGKTLAIIDNHSGVYPRCDDFGIAHLQFANGILGTIEAAWKQTGGLEGLEIVGSKKTLWNTPSGYVYAAPRATPEPLPLPAVGKPTYVDRLVAAIRGELPVTEQQSDLTACYDAVRMMAACYASAASGHWEAI